jgi:hypothetical protein
MMSEEAQGGKTGTRASRSTWRRRLRIALGVLLVLVVVFVVPPWISLGRYQKRIVQVLSSSVGRPVEISSVEMRLLPRPGFNISNLSIAEDPAYGAEPVLHANSVRANIRLLSLWRGRLEISSIVVDEASLNVVRAGSEKWNLDPLLRNAAQKAGAGAGFGQGAHFPSLEATNSRVNFKNGAEKLPFSLVNTDLSFWQQSPGDWRLRLKGQPSRTDFAFQQGDSGTVRIEASMKRAAQLSEVPLNVDLEWREAQLGQLSRLVFGSDPGWRGDLTGNLHVEGTPSAAHLTARLRASGVHREEFASPTPLDFDVNCGLLYHYAARKVEGLNCDTPIGNGRVKLTGGVPGGGLPAQFALELDKIPVEASLDLLRTMRSGLAADLQAAGTVSGRIDYNQQGGTADVSAKQRVARGQRQAEGQSPLTGSLTVSGFSLKGGSLTQPIAAEKIVLSPVRSVAGSQALEGTATFSLGGVEPMSVSTRLAGTGYSETVHGQVSIARARELMLTFGWPQAAALKDLAGDPLALNVALKGPWLGAEASNAGAETAGVQLDMVNGTVSVHNAAWKSNYLVNPVEITQATLNLSPDAMRWEAVSFSYGPVKGTGGVSFPLSCAAPAVQPADDACAPEFKVQFGALDASALEAALLGAREKGSVISQLLDRLHPAAAPVWPKMHGTVSADALVLGPVKIERASATIGFAADSAELSGFKGRLLGGSLDAKGTLRWAQGDAQQPAYAIEARCERLSAALVGQLLGQKWSGGPITLAGKVEAAGFTEKDLSATAKGVLHFDWSQGAMSGTRFDAWSGDAAIGNGAVTIGTNDLAAGGKKQAVEGGVTFGSPAKVQLSVAKGR